MSTNTISFAFCTDAQGQYFQEMFHHYLTLDGELNIEDYVKESAKDGTLTITVPEEELYDHEKNALLMLSIANAYKDAMKYA